MPDQRRYGVKYNWPNKVRPAAQGLEDLGFKPGPLTTRLECFETRGGKTHLWFEVDPAFPRALPRGKAMRVLARVKARAIERGWKAALNKNGYLVLWR